MKKNQRKEIIQQVKDIVNTRGVVSVDNVNTSGYSFKEDPAIGIPDGLIGHDIMVEWEVVAVIDDLGGVFPSSTIFTDFIYRNNGPVNTRTKAALNGLFDIALSENKLIRYRTWLVPSDTLAEYMYFSGRCKAMVYVDGMPVITHEYDSTEPETSITTSSTSKVLFREGRTIEIEVVVYTENTPNDKGLKLESELFRFLDSAHVREVERPVNTYATNNLPNSIKISWEQPLDQVLFGGGVEIWAKHTGIDEEYAYLDRVPYPTNYYIQSSHIGGAVINDNPYFADYVMEGGGDVSTVALPNGEASYGLIGWTTTYTPSVEALYVPAETYDYESYIYISNGNPSSEFLSEIIDYNTPISDDQTNFNNTSGVSMIYDGTYFIHADCTGVCENIGSADVRVGFYWEPSLDIIDSDVRCTVYKGGTPATTVAPAIDGTAYVYLSSSDVNEVLLDSSYISAKFEVRASDVNSGDSTDFVILKRIQYEYSTPTNYAYAFTLSSEELPVSYGDEITLDIIHKFNNMSSYLFIVSEYDSNGDYLLSSSGNLDTIYEDRWKRERGTHTIASTTASYITVQMVYAYPMFSDTRPEITLQKVEVLKTATVTLSPDTEYTYKIRNYSNDFRYSEFTDIFNGKTSQEVYHMSITPDSRTFSQYKPLDLDIISTTTLQSVSAEVDSENGIIVPLNQTYASTNNAEFSYRLTPLLYNCVIYDVFDTEAKYKLPQITSTLEVSERSPAKLKSQWEVTSTASCGIYPGTETSLWSSYVLNVNDFRNTVLFYGQPINGNWKNYNISKWEDFYSGTFSDDFNETYQGTYFNIDNQNMFSLGFTFKIPQWDTGDTPIVISRSGSIFSVFIYPETATYDGHVLLVVTVRGTHFDGDLNWGSVVLRHTVPVHDNGIPYNDWYYVHCSADIQDPNNSERTYISLHNVSSTTDTSVPNLSSTPVVVTEENSSYFNWENATDVRLGYSTTAPAGSVCTMFFDTFYLTCGVVEKSVITDVVSPIITEQRNPYFPSYGYKPTEVLTVRAEGVPARVSPHDFIGGEVTYDSGLLVADCSISSDWFNPDGTMYILRDTFTIKQVDIDNLSDTQPLYTYSRSNKLYVDMTAYYGNVSYVRFSNDKETWGNWVAFNNQTLYPWELAQDEEGDTTAGGNRTVYCQAMTDTLNTSSPFMADTHNDTIYYNPLASVGSLESYNYISGTSGWSIGLNGDAEFNDVWIRGNAKVSGRNLGSGLLNTAWVNGQLTEEQASSIFESKRRVASYSFFRGLFYHRSIPGGFYSMEYPGDFELDLENEDIAYVVGVSDNLSSSYVVKIDMKANDDDYPFIENEYPNNLLIMSRPASQWDGLAQGETEYRYLPHVCLDSSNVYVADATTLYKCTKDLEIIETLDMPRSSVNGGDIWSYNFCGTITGIKLAHGSNGTKNLYVMHGYISDEGQEYADIKSRTVTIVDPDTMQAKQAASFGYQTGNSIDYTRYNFAGNDFDCNGEHLVFIDFFDENLEFGSESERLPKVVMVKLTGSGLFDPDRFRSSADIDGTTFFGSNLYTGAGGIGAINYYDPYLREFQCGFRTKGFGGVRLFDKKIVAFTTPGKECSEHFCFSEDYNNLLGVFDLGTLEVSAEPSESYEGMKPSSAYLLAGSRNTVSSYKLSNYEFVEESLEDLTDANHDIQYSRTLKPYEGYSTSIIFNTGYGIPTIVGSKLYVPFIRSFPSYTDLLYTYFSPCAGTAILSFDIVGGGLVYNGIVENIRNETVVALKYDGKYLWKLSFDNTSTKLDEDGNYKHKKMYIKREIV